MSVFIEPIRIKFLKRSVELSNQANGEEEQPGTNEPN